MQPHLYVPRVRSTWAPCTSGPSCLPSCRYVMPRTQVDVQAVMRVSLKGCGRLVASASGNGYKYCFQIIHIRKSSNYLHFKGTRTLLIAIITSSIEFISAMNIANRSAICQEYGFYSSRHGRLYPFSFSREIRSEL